MKNGLVLVTGGCGYKGSVLVPKLLEAGYAVRVLDNQWFGNYLKPHDQLQVLKGDTRGDLPLDGVEAVVHLAAIANDPCGELDARLTWDVNVLATYRLAQECARRGVRHFIFASSASIYGIKGNEPVTEETSFEPVSDYNKTKMVAEKLLGTLSGDMAMTFLRPATVCGVSPRMRLDVVVNMLTAQALEKGHITAHCGAHGGQLMRPHMHIEDVTDLYVWALQTRVTGAFNAASDNQSVVDTAKLITEVVPAEITLTTVADKRSYVVNFNKLVAAGFKPQHSVRDAIADIAAAWSAGALRRDPSMINLRWMQSQGLVDDPLKKALEQARAAESAVRAER